MTVAVVRVREWLGVVGVTLGIFSIVTAEMLPVGLLGPMGSSFGLSAGRTGWLMTMPGLVAAVAAPVVTVLTARLDRRVMLCALMALLAGNAPTRGVGSRVRRCAGVLDELVRPGRPART
ncbi:hypothetical protein EV652_115189 [Kribbella steppae]|uniref:MFS transporter n=1 Tax=Kribbella steppae TaxID=2512223 RepID=A0A4R2H263_9ACTN|nr:hypothetical protein [Kribbella steppae]TCO18644.1 hypothetical protein EV652_115189 [Kribbella steppae]